ncbi:hypothetical protein [Flavobacterium sp. FlaQc-48]|uniref:hypothetical protein n=1 Tax=Flavobacterium sp. FlaQc-48 TaxID=3374181 RepID=UPI003756E95E
MIFDETTKKEFLDGYFVYDGCFGFEEDRYGFLLLENDKNKHQYRDPLPETQFLFIKTSRSIDERFYAMNTKQFDFSTISAGTAPGKEDFVSVDTGGFVFSWDNEFENKIPNNIPDCNFISSIAKVVRVNGYIYALGSGWRIYKREGHVKWSDNLNSLPVPKDFIDDTASTDYFFRDMAGFSESDLYAVGDAGSVFHFDGKKWDQLAFPTNIRLTTVTCAGNGQAYISDKNCAVWVGRGAKWKKLTDGDMSLYFFDSAWFDGQMWFANDYGIWVLENDQLVLAKDSKHKPIPEDVAVLCGRIDISPDNKRMLICGQRGAAVYDGERWETLFTCDLPIEDEA